MINNKLFSNAEFSSLYELAKVKNKLLLIEKINLGIDLDAWFGCLRLTTLFAEQGNHDVVEFLLHEFCLSVDNAAEGYARAKNKTEVEKLIKQGANVHYVVNGYAYGGHKQEVDELLSQLDHADGNAIDGYAQGGYHNEVNKLLKNTNSLYAMYGYACVGNKKELHRIWNQKHADKALYAYALGGHHENVNELLDKTRMDKLPALQGYAAGGNIDKFNEIAETEDDIYQYSQNDYTAFESGRHGQKKQVLSLTCDWGKRRALSGASTSGYVSIINAIIQNQKNPDGFVKDYWNIKKNQKFLEKREYSSPHVSFKLQRIASLIDNKTFRECIVEYAHRFVPQINTQKMLHNASIFNRKIRKNNLTYPQAQEICKAYLNIWLLQGNQLIDKKLTLAAYIIITQFLTGYSYMNAKDLVDRYALSPRNLVDKSDTLSRGSVFYCPSCNLI